MACVGIDIGSDSARLVFEVPGLVRTKERPLFREEKGPASTMSALDLWRAVEEMIGEAIEEGQNGHSQSKQVPKAGGDQNAKFDAAKCTGTMCVAATCSLVVMERAQVGGRACFRLVEPGREVVVWMDRRAEAEAEWLNKRLAPDVLAQVGGAITAEMGLAKMKWAAAQYPGRQLVFFELHDWVSYVLMAGAKPDGRAVVVDELEGAVVSFGPGERAMDGSVKGWGVDVMAAAELNVEVAGAPRFAQENKSYHQTAETEYFGAVLGPATRPGFMVLRGCIDCYAGPAAPFVQRRSADGQNPEQDGGSNIPLAEDSNGVVSMIAGTLTCFVAAVPGAQNPIPGLWGPFPQLIPCPVYSFGQPASGKLLGEVLRAHGAEDFSRVEAEAARLEQASGAPLSRLARHSLYYGDKHGNRSPYGDFCMDEVCVRGHNAAAADEVCAKVSGDPAWPLVLDYYLALEFLAFQAAQLLQALPAVSAVHMSGSQAGNARFALMVALMVAPAPVYVEAGSAKWAGARACARLGAAPERKLVHPLPQESTRFLREKYAFWIELANWQSRWRKHNRHVHGQ